MGQEIDASYFSPEDFKEFNTRLRNETAILHQWFTEQRFECDRVTGGFEIEAWLVDRQQRPAPVNDAFLQVVDNPLVVPELARFNVEINTSPHALRDAALSDMQHELEATRAACDRAADTLGVRMITIGILPTVRDEELSLENMSSMQRYSALNEQVLRIRKGRPLKLDIHGREHRAASHHDVMLEAAATSLQLHIQVPEQRAVRYYNAARVLSGPMVAVCANAPYLFGRDLWDETRIPLFQQSVATTDPDQAHRPERVGFGEDYAQASLMECFETNYVKYPVLLPRLLDTAPEELAHLRLHNGTIWRWNRPLIGFRNGRPHLRIEHRVVSAPTSNVDTIANAALFFGLVHSLALRDTPPESILDFSHARRNFYAAARHGLMADMLWLRGSTVPVYRLLIDELLPLAHLGLMDLGLRIDDVHHYLGIIEARLANRQNGAAWQRAWVEKHGKDMAALTEAYLERQQSGLPVHEWTI